MVGKDFRVVWYDKALIQGFLDIVNQPYSSLQYLQLKDHAILHWIWGEGLFLLKFTEKKLTSGPSDITCE